MEFIQQLINRIRNRKRCSDIAIPAGKIYKCSLDDSVSTAMTEMKAHVFTHTPIVDEAGRVIGVFDENSLFNYLEAESIITAEGLKFRDIEKYLALDRGNMEKFLFRKSALYADELEADFQKQLRNQSRLEVVFLTASGKESEPITGMITPWDMLGNEE